MQQEKVTPLGRGFIEFKFSMLEDMCRVWSIGVYNLDSGLLRLSKSSSDFSPYNK